MRVDVGGARVEVIQGDITEQSVDAIVNAANAQLQLGGGVAGTIKRRGGPVIQQECDRIGGTPVGSAVVTSGGALLARWVIHAVGPRMGEGHEDQKLAGAVTSALRVAAQRGLGSVALPAISTGVFGYPLAKCARISLRCALEHFRPGGPVRLIRIVLYDREALHAFRSELHLLASGDPGCRVQE